MDRERLVADRYRLIEPIGAGGMGQVWAAEDTVLGRDVAVKLHRVDPAGPRRELERFLREARATAALQHPNVVTVYDSGVDGDQGFLIMELLPGPTLQAYISEHGPLSERRAVALATQVAAGVAAAHGAGVVHRDIKPSNVMFDAHGRVRIVDFGIARLTETSATGMTMTNSLIGSPPYLSPEQFLGEAADERSDLYALGCLLMTLLTGRPPFEGEHPVAYGHQHVYAAPPSISQRRPDVSPAIESLVGRLLSKDPQDRPDSAQQVLAQLRAWEPMPAHAAELPVELPVQGIAVIGPTIRARALPAHADVGPDRPRRRGTRLRTAALRLTVAAALALVVVMAALMAGATGADVPIGSQVAVAHFWRQTQAGAPNAGSTAPPSSEPGHPVQRLVSSRAAGSGHQATLGRPLGTTTLGRQAGNHSGALDSSTDSSTVSSPESAAGNPPDNSMGNLSDDARRSSTGNSTKAVSGPNAGPKSDHQVPGHAVGGRQHGQQKGHGPDDSRGTKAAPEHKAEHESTESEDRTKD